MERGANRDVVSDPAHSDNEGRDWSDEGGAVHEGPATDPGEDELEDGQLSEVGRMDPADADTPISDGDAAAGYPPSETGEAQEPQPEAGPNANPHRDRPVR